MLFCGNPSRNLQGPKAGHSFNLRGIYEESNHDFEFFVDPVGRPIERRGKCFYSTGER